MICQHPPNIRQLVFKSDLPAIPAVVPCASSLISEKPSAIFSGGFRLTKLSSLLHRLWLCLKMGFAVHSEDKESFENKNKKC